MAEWWLFSKPSPPKSTPFSSSQQNLPPSEGGMASHQGLVQFSQVAATLGLLLLKNLCGSLTPQGQISINP